MKTQRLEKEHDRLHGEWDVRNDLLTRLGQALIVETDTNVKFKLEKQIQYELEQQKQLENRLDEIEQSLNSCNSQMPVQITSVSQPHKSVDLNTVPLESENGLDYRNLRDLLKVEKWREADKETLAIMLKIAKQNVCLNEESFEKLPCKDLQTIDRLWTTASNGHFGFSVQTKIWLECGSPISRDDNFRRFLDRVGWRNESQVINYNYLKFSLSDSPIGELPGFAYVGIVLERGTMILVGNSSEFGWKYIFYRMKKCGL
jgi:GUN4-like